MKAISKKTSTFSIDILQENIVEVKLAQQRILEAIDILHPGTAIDNLRLMHRIEELFLSHLQEWKRMGCMRDGHISCERCSPETAGEKP